MESNAFEFTAIRGIQAGSAYYVIMCALKHVPRLFRFDDEAVPPELRAQRVLNRARVPAISRYIIENPSEYILSSLCASVDGEMEFAPAANEGPLRSVGTLRIGMSATILINDGQHRRAAIEQAIRDRPYLGDETISIVVFPDHGLLRSQQMFADLNMHAVRPTKSISVLYNHRDTMAALVRNVVQAVPLFREFTEREKTTISNRSVKLFTLNGIFKSTTELLGRSMGSSTSPSDEDEALAIQFWTEVIRHMPDWGRVANRQVSAAELRQEYVHAHGIALQALAIAGRQLLTLHPHDWRKRLKGLSGVDWSRTNHRLWEGRALISGRLNPTRNNTLLVANVILRALQLPFTPESERAEHLHIVPESTISSLKQGAVAHA